MKAIIITYDLKKMILKDKAKFFRKFHGYTDKSNKAQYTYQREGLLQKIPHLKPGKQVIIIPEEHKTEIIKILKKKTQKTKL